MGSGTLDSYIGPTRSLWRSGIPYKLVTSGGSEVEADTSPLEDDWIIAGGSSGGSAVAVLSGAAYVALGSDTGGSVRIPAGWTGVVSIKPTYGILSRHGLVPLVNSLDVPGIFAKKVEDLVVYLKLLAGHDPLDSTSSVSSLDVCLDPEFNPAEVASNMSRYDGLQYGLRGFDESSTEAMYADSRSKGFNSVVRGRILAGNYFLLKKHYSEYFLNALKIRRLIQDDFLSAFNDVDIMLT